MKLTVKQLAEASGVSVRTLHHYHHIGLLIPAHIAENGYRYYGKAELMQLQQILIFRELEMPLAKVREILVLQGDELCEQLHTHKSLLLARAARTNELIATIDKTIKELKGDEEMKAKDFFKGFDMSKQAEYEKEIEEKYGRELLEESQKRTKGWSQQKQAEVMKNLDSLLRDFVGCLQKGSEEDSEETQALTKRHFAWINQFYDCSKETYLGLSDLYVQDPRFRKTHADYHDELPEYLSQAMKRYAENEVNWR